MSARTFTLSRRAITVGLLVPVAVGLLSERGRIVPATSRFDAGAPAEPNLETSQSVSFFESRIKRDPMDFYAYNSLGGSYLQRARELGDIADYRRAELALRRSIEIYSKTNLNGYLLLGAVQVGQHQFADALSSSERARAIRPGEPAVDALAGDALIGLGRYDEATAAYQRLHDKQPDLTSLSRMSQISELRGDLDAAWSFYDQALAADSPVQENLAWLRVQRGVLLYNRGNLTGAEAEFREGETVFPGYVHGVAGVARVQAARADYANSVDLYQRVVNRMPLPQYVIEFGEVLLAAGRSDDARQQFALIRAIDQLYQANGVDTDLQMSLYAADHEPDLSGWLARVRGLAQRLPTIYAADALAWMLYRTGDLAGAAAAMTDALRLGTREPLLFYHAGMIAKARGERDQALDYLEQVKSLNPRFSVYHADSAARSLQDLRKPA